MNERWDSIIIQHGSTATLRVASQDRWYVIEERWEGDALLDSVILASYATEAEATARADVERRRVAG